MITLCNLRNTKPEHPWDVRVDRSSILGNPYKDERELSCDKYHEYFLAQVEKSESFIQELRRLWHIHTQYKQLRLFCWCMPLRCHSETIKEFLDQYIDQKP